MGKSDLIEDETSLAYRLSNLRKDHDLSQKQLADQLHVTHSQISRIESGETKNPNISIVIDAARFFHVSTDYLLGITQITSPKSYDISELGLSEEAVTRLITRRIDVDILNRLLEHECFPKLCIMIRNYFDDTIAEGIMARNKVIDFAVDQLTDLMTAEPSKRKEIIKDKQFLSSHKLGANEADIEKIKIQFMAILRDVKSGIQRKEPIKAVATFWLFSICFLTRDLILFSTSSSVISASINSRILLKRSFRVLPSSSACFSLIFSDRCEAMVSASLL